MKLKILEKWELFLNPFIITFATVICVVCFLIAYILFSPISASSIPLDTVVAQHYRFLINSDSDLRIAHCKSILNLRSAEDWEVILAARLLAAEDPDALFPFVVCTNSKKQFIAGYFLNRSTKGKMLLNQLSDTAKVQLSNHDEIITLKCSLNFDPENTENMDTVSRKVNFSSPFSFLSTDTKTFIR